MVYLYVKIFENLPYVLPYSCSIQHPDPLPAALQAALTSALGSVKMSGRDFYLGSPFCTKMESSFWKSHGKRASRTRFVVGEGNVVPPPVMYWMALVVVNTLTILLIGYAWESVFWVDAPIRWRKACRRLRTPAVLPWRGFKMATRRLCLRDDVFIWKCNIFV